MSNSLWCGYNESKTCYITVKKYFKQASNVQQSSRRAFTLQAVTRSILHKVSTLASQLTAFIDFLNTQSHVAVFITAPLAFGTSSYF